MNGSNQAVRSFRQRRKQQGMVEVSVWVFEHQRDHLRAYAAELLAKGEAERSNLDPETPDLFEAKNE